MGITVGSDPVEGIDEQDECPCGDTHEPYGDLRDVWIREIHGIDMELHRLTLEEERIYETRMELEQSKHELHQAMNRERDY